MNGNLINPCASILNVLEFKDGGKNHRSFSEQTPPEIEHVDKSDREFYRFIQ